MPAAAVIPTPGVSMVDAAVKKSVVVGAVTERRLSAQSLPSVAERTGDTV